MILRYRFYNCCSKINRLSDHEALFLKLTIPHCMMQNNNIHELEIAYAHRYRQMVQ